MRDVCSTGHWLLLAWQPANAVQLRRAAKRGVSVPRHLGVGTLAEEADGAVGRARDDAHARALAGEVHQVQQLVPHLPHTINQQSLQQPSVEYQTQQQMRTLNK